MHSKNYYSWNGDNLLLELQIQSNARKNSIAGIYNNRLKISITAAPIDNKANKQLIKFLATQFNVTRKQITIIKGTINKYKTVLITNPKINRDKFKTLHSSLE